MSNVANPLTKLQEHGCAKKLVPPQKVVMEHARQMREKLLQIAIREEFLALIGEQTIDELVGAISSQVPIADCAQSLKRWAAKLEPTSWDHFLDRGLRAAVESVDPRLREMVLAKLGQIAASLCGKER